jgi:hypothetical protein
MKIANATELNRKSGVAQWRDLLCACLPSKAGCPISRALCEMWEMKLLSRASLPGDRALPRKH